MRHQQPTRRNSSGNPFRKAQAFPCRAGAPTKKRRPIRFVLQQASRHFHAQNRNGQPEHLRPIRLAHSETRRLSAKAFATGNSDPNLLRKPPLPRTLLCPIQNGSAGRQTKSDFKQISGRIPLSSHLRLFRRRKHHPKNQRASPGIFRTPVLPLKTLCQRHAAGRFQKDIADFSALVAQM